MTEILQLIIYLCLPLGVLFLAWSKGKRDERNVQSKREADIRRRMEEIDVIGPHSPDDVLRKLRKKEF